MSKKHKSVWAQFEKAVRRKAMGRIHVGGMAPTFPLEKILSYMTRSVALGFYYSMVVGASDQFVAIAERCYNTVCVEEMPPDATAFVNYDPVVQETLSHDICSPELRDWMDHLGNKAEVMELIDSGVLQVPTINDKQLATRDELVEIVLRLRDENGHAAVYVQAESTEGAFATLTFTADHDRSDIEAYLGKVSDERFVVAPYVRVLAAVGLTFFKDGRITEPVLNLTDPSDLAGSSIGTIAPFPEGVAKKYAVELELIKLHAVTVAGYMLDGVGEDDNFLSANVDFIIYELDGEVHIAFMEYNARLTHYTIISRGAYSNQLVLGYAVPHYEEYSMQLSGGENGTAVLGNDNIYVDPDKARSYAEVLDILKAEGVDVGGRGAVRVLPCRDYFHDEKHPVVGFIIVAEDDESQVALVMAAEKYKAVVSALGGDRAYHGEVDAILRPDT